MLSLVEDSAEDPAACVSTSTRLFSQRRFVLHSLCKAGEEWNGKGWVDTPLHGRGPGDETAPIYI